MQSQRHLEHLKYYAKNKERILKRMKNNYKLHKEQKLLANKAWREINQEHMRELIKNWAETHRDKRREQGRKSQRTNRANRKGFHFVELNKPFKGSEAHHINREFIFYIPKELHKSVRHSVLRNQNMVEMNAKALLWVGV